MQDENTTAVAEPKGWTKRPKFKKTMLMLTPEGWEIKTFEEIGVFSKEKNINNNELKLVQQEMAHYLKELDL